MPISLQGVVVFLLSVLLALWLPLLILTYYYLRLGLRRRALSARIIEMHLEPDYLRMYDFKSWDDLCGHTARSQDKGKDKEKVRDRIRAGFEKTFASQFGSSNRFSNYMLPLVLTAMSMLFFASVVYGTLTLPNFGPSYVQNGTLALAIAGAFLYISPLYISRYARLALTPHSLLELLLRLWLAVILGVLLAPLLADTLRPVAAFVGGLVPMASYDWLRTKVFPQYNKQEETEEAVRMKKLLQLLHLDEDLLDQLQHIGIRSVLELAYENPLRLFVETDLNLVVCIDLVDQANLWLYVPDENIRQDLNRYGIRTAIDIMTQTRERFKRPDGIFEYRFLRHDEALPDYMLEPLENIRKAMKLESLSALRNTMQMMIDNPQLEYIRQLWEMVNEAVDRSTTIDETAVPASDSVARGAQSTVAAANPP